MVKNLPTMVSTSSADLWDHRDILASKVGHERFLAWVCASSGKHIARGGQKYWHPLLQIIANVGRDT